MLIPGSTKMNMTQAAEWYVSQYMGHRAIGEWCDNFFQLKDGVKWYRLSVSAIGWEISEADAPPEPPTSGDVGKQAAISNEHLLAAAPGLLAACEAITGAIPYADMCDPAFWPIVEACRTAIAKAKGQQ